MILFLGDIHGQFEVLARAQELAARVGAKAIVQIGDLGLFPANEHIFREMIKASNIPIKAIDGNHDNHEYWYQRDEVYQLYQDRPLFIVPRGTVMTLDNRTIAFMGGAASIDKATRIQYNWHWDPRENIVQTDIDRLRKNVEGKSVDIFVTHVPPQIVIKENFDNANKIAYGVGPGWEDPNASIIEELWKQMDYPYLICGHMHKQVRGTTYRILAIDEMEGV